MVYMWSGREEALLFLLVAQRPEGGHPPLGEMERHLETSHHSFASSSL